MFAVDAPLESSIKACEFIESAPISNEQREMICHQNASRLLGLGFDRQG